MITRICTAYLCLIDSCGIYCPHYKPRNKVSGCCSYFRKTKITYDEAVEKYKHLAVPGTPMPGRD